MLFWTDAPMSRTPRNSTIHNSQDVESSVVAIGDRESVGCREGSVSQVLAAEHEDLSLIPSAPVKSRV